MSISDSRQKEVTEDALPKSTIVSRINLAAKTIWRRIFRAQRNRKVSVWPKHTLAFIVVAIAAIWLASQFDAAMAEQMAGRRNQFLLFLKNVTDVAKSHYYLVPALLIMTVVSSLDWRARNLSAQKLLIRAYERAAFIFVAIAIPGIVTNIVKQLVGRGRPITFEEHGAYVFSPFEFLHKFQSFPSGHSTTAGALGMIIALYIPSLRWPALVFAGFLAFSRVPARAHYLSDVTAGYMIGAAATLLFARYLATRSIMFRLDAGSKFPKLKK